MLAALVERQRRVWVARIAAFEAARSDLLAKLPELGAVLSLAEGRGGSPGRAWSMFFADLKGEVASLDREADGLLGSLAAIESKIETALPSFSSCRADVPSRASRPAPGDVPGR